MFSSVRVGAVLGWGSLLLVGLCAACHDGGHAAEQDAEPGLADMDADVEEASPDAEEDELDAPLDGAAPSDAGPQDARVVRDAISFDAVIGPAACADPAHCNWLSLTALPGQSCALREDRTLWCWGNRRQGPEQIEVRGGVTQISGNAGPGAYACLVSGAGDLLCYDQPRFAVVGAGRGFAQVAVAGALACALLTDGKVSCWKNPGGFPERAVRAEPLLGTEALKATQLVASDLHACAIDDQQQLWCWDLAPPKVPIGGGVDAGVPSDAGNDAGPPDAGASAVAAFAPVVPRQLGPAQRYTKLSLGRRELCALRVSGELDCWSASALYPAPTQTREPGRAFRALALSDDHGCAVAMDGSLWCWGAGASGQLGNGALTDSVQPLRVGTGNDWVEVAAAITHTCARNAAQQIWCWGDNFSGAIGTPTTGFTATPRRLAPERSFVDLSLANSGGCAISAQGELWCWGPPDTVGPPEGSSQLPARIGSASDWTGVYVAERFSCGLRGAGDIWCWGDGSYDRLPGGSDAGVVNAPTLVHPGQRFQRLTTDGSTICGLSATGALRCWGGNRSGTFGVAYDGSDTLVDVEPTRAFRSAAIDDRTYAVTTDGKLWEWRSGPATMLQGMDYTEVQAAGGSECALRTDGVLYCWGTNSLGMTGTGDIGNVTWPAAMKTSERFASVALYGGRSCALTLDGRLFCAGWRVNVDSTESQAQSNTPFAVQPDRRFKKVSHAYAGVCGIQTDGALVCWGDTSRKTIGPDERLVANPLRVPLP